MSEFFSKFSSHVDSIRYDNGDMIVNYSNGSNVRYKGVPESVFTEVNRAASVGTAIRTLIKGKYQFEYIT